MTKNAAYWKSLTPGNLYKLSDDNDSTVLLVKAPTRRTRMPVGIGADDWFRVLTVMFPETGEMEELELYDDLDYDIYEGQLPLTPV